MNEYIKQWNEVICNGSVDNTYKMAWARSIVELCVEKENPQGEVIFDFKEKKVKVDELLRTGLYEESLRGVIVNGE